MEMLSQVLFCPGDACMPGVRLPVACLPFRKKGSQLRQALTVHQPGGGLVYIKDRSHLPDM